MIEAIIVSSGGNQEDKKRFATAWRRLAMHPGPPAKTAQAADQRAAAAEARARDEAARQLAQTRADVEREREDLRTGLDARAADLVEIRDGLRSRAERPEHDLDEARAELTRLRPSTGDDETVEAAAPRPARRCRSGQTTGRDN